MQTLPSSGLLYRTNPRLQFSCCKPITVQPQPATRLLYGPLGQGYHLRSHIVLMVERDEDGSFIASDDDYGVYGVGDTEDAAQRDYVNSLKEYYDIIESGSHSHAPSRVALRQLQQHIAKVRTAG